MVAVLYLLSSANVQAEPPGPQPNELYLPVVIGPPPSGWQWSSLPTVELSPVPSGGPVSVIDSERRVHLFWDSKTPPQFVYHTFLGDQGWTDPQPVGQPLGTSHVLGPPAVGADGALHLVWRSIVVMDGKKAYTLQYARFDGEQWSEPVEIYRSEFGTTGQPYLDAQGNLRVAVWDMTIWAAFARQATQTEGGWTVSDVIKPGLWAYLQIWPDQEGGLRLYGNNINTWLYSYLAGWCISGVESANRRHAIESSDPGRSAGQPACLLDGSGADSRGPCQWPLPSVSRQHSGVGRKTDSYGRSGRAPRDRYGEFGL